MLSYYVYLIHEAPIERPFNCKIGFTSNPQRRLSQLQAGNPRYLRSWDQSRRPVGEFGLKFHTRGLAFEFEQLIFKKLGEMGVRLRRDYDYERDVAEIREWVQEIHPDTLGILMIREYAQFVNARRIAHIVAPILADYVLPDKNAHAS